MSFVIAETFMMTVPENASLTGFVKIIFSKTTSK